MAVQGVLAPALATALELSMLKLFLRPGSLYLIACFGVKMGRSHPLWVGDSVVLVSLG